MKRRVLLMTALLAEAGTGAWAQSADEAARRRRLAIDISKELRDPSSVNFSLFESESAVAGELKAEIYAQLAKGKKKAEVIDFFAERYGDAIRYDPAMKTSTAVLWAAPWLLLALAGLVAWKRRGTKSK